MYVSVSDIVKGCEVVKDALEEALEKPKLLSSLKHTAYIIGTVESRYYSYWCLFQVDSKRSFIEILGNYEVLQEL